MGEPFSTFVPSDADLGPGEWTPNAQVDPLTNVAGRWARGESGRVYLFGACIVLEPIEAWFFPASDVDGETG